MTARAILHGVLFRAPEAKTSKTGRPYAVATIREGAGDSVRWWKCFVFGESAVEEVLRLGDGEPIAIAGAFDCKVYVPSSGESRLSWRITADAVISAGTKPNAREKRSRTQRGVATKSYSGTEDQFSKGEPNDDLPF